MNSGILFAFSAAVSFGLANMVDAFLTKKHFQSAGVLLFFSCILNLTFTVPVVLHPEFALPDNGRTWLLLLLSSQLHLLSYYLLYKALKLYDTSVITCLITISLAVVPVLGAVFDYEPLEKMQWAGFALCLCSTLILSWQKNADHKTKKGILYALICGGVFVTIAFTDDYLSNHLHWSAQYGGIQFFMLVPMLGFLAHMPFRRNIAGDIPLFRKNLHGFFLSELSFAAGTIFLFCAYKRASVSVVEAIIASMPVIVLAMSFILPRKWTNDDMSREALPRKAACFALTVLGVYLLY